jgi:hypothetical protein
MMEAWLNIDDMKNRVVDEYTRAIASGIDKEAARVKAAAFLAVNRDQIIRLDVSLGIVDLLLKLENKTGK